MVDTSSRPNVADQLSGKPICNPKAACQPCDRSGLQLLLVGPSVIPKEHAPALAQTKATWAKTFDAKFSAVQREATVPVARLLPNGYVYAFYPQRQRWDVWQVMSNHLTRKILHQVSTTQYTLRQAAFASATKPKVCSRGAANVPAHFIDVHGASATAALWLAYSAHLWAPMVLKRFTQDAALRTQHGCEISPQGILGGTVPKGAMALNATNLEAHVVDYCATARPGAWPSNAFQTAFSNAVYPLDLARFGQAAQVDQSIRTLERAYSPPANREQYLNTTLILMLPDDIGVIETHNHLRLTAREARQAWVAGATDFTGSDDDAVRAWKLRSALHLETIEKSVYNQNLEEEKKMLAAGRYRTSSVIGGTEYHMIVAQEARTHELVNPPGTVYERLPGSPERYRVTFPDDYVQSGLEGIAQSKSKDKIERYRGKVRMNELTTFRQAFEQGMKRWDDHLLALDGDFVTWLTHPRLAGTLRDQFDLNINLLKPDNARSTLLQQVADAMAYVQALDKAWGGGAITPRSAKQLAAAFGNDPNAPATWINAALLEPFGYAKAIAEDTGKQKDTAEKINGLLRELPDQVKQALNHGRKLWGESLESLSAVQQQAAHLQTVLTVGEHAKAIGTATRSVEAAERALIVQIRTANMLNLLTNPGAEAYVTIAVKVPSEQAFNKTLDVFNRAKPDTELALKNETTRQTRRKTGSELRRLNRKGELPEYQSVMLTEKRLQELERLAVRQGDEMVDVIASDVLGKELPQNFRLPKSTALNLIGEQASMAKAASQAVLSHQGLVVGVLAVFQIRALCDSLKNLDTKSGYEHTDALMGVFTSTTGLVEGSATLLSGYYSIKTQGSKLVLAGSLTTAAMVRLVAGIAGAAGSAFDGVAAYAKYLAAKNRGNREAANAYGMSSSAFFSSFAGISLGTGLSFANATIARLALSRAVITTARQMAIRAGSTAAAGLGAEAAGVWATGFAGGALTGIGVVLGVAGFGYLLYAQSLEDDLNEIFFKRSYWGSGETLQAKFGGAPPLKDINNTQRSTEQLQQWGEQGLAAEQHGFEALWVGLKATVEWHDNTFSADVLQARVESYLNPDEQRRLAYTLQVYGQGNQVVFQESKRDLQLVFDKDAGRFAVEVQWPLNAAQWAAAQSARFEYNLYQTYERASVARDRLDVKKKST